MRSGRTLRHSSARAITGTASFFDIENSSTRRKSANTHLCLYVRLLLGSLPDERLLTPATSSVCRRIRYGTTRVARPLSGALCSPSRGTPAEDQNHGREVHDRARDVGLE